eukprot:s2033_g4.t1
MSRCWPKSHAIHATISRGGLIGRQQHLMGDLLTTRYEVVRELGSGGFGKVNLVREKATGLMRVIKTVDTAKLSERLLENMREEIQVLRALDHPNIIRLFEPWLRRVVPNGYDPGPGPENMSGSKEYGEDVENHKIHLLMEKCSGGDVDELLEKAGCLSEDLVAQLMRQVLSGIAFCHARGVVHRDLKPGNVMLTSSSLRELPPVHLSGSCYNCAILCQESTYDCKIIDFGLAKTFDPTDPNSGISDVNGTPAYMAPEICWRQGKYGAPSDVWSMGVMCYELLTGCLPFGDASDYDGGFRELFEITKKYENMDSFWTLMPEALKGWRSHLRDRCSSGVKDFVTQLLLRDPKTRFTAQKALQHPWIASYKPERDLGDGLTSKVLESIKAYAQATYFVKICLLLIAARLNAEKLEPFRHAFLGVDTDASPWVSIQAQHLFFSWRGEGNGSLSMEEFLEAVENLQDRRVCCGHSRGQIHRWFQQIDLNKDGRLDYSEFLAACLHSKLHRFGDGDGEVLASQAFQAIDADGDGLATLSDLEHFFHSDAKTLGLDGLLPRGPFDVHTFHACTTRRVKAGDEVHCMMAVKKLVEERRHLDIKIACKVNTGSQQIHYFRWM